jgi:predicted nucleic acid-binding protein
VKRIAIDTNMLISFVTDRNKEQQEYAVRLFAAALHSHLAIICHQNVLTEFVYVLDKVYGQEHGAINTMLRDLLATPGVEVVNDLDHQKLLDIWPMSCADYGDAVLLTYCKGRRDVSLATFDHKLINRAMALGAKVYT